MNTHEIQAYYDYTLPFYKVFWHGETRALHFGLYEKQTDTFKEALLNSNRVVAEKGRISSSDCVLDLGCGVGGTAFWIAKHTGAHVTGVTLSHKQYTKAMELRERYELEDKTTFFERDYFQTGLPSNSFDVAYGIESICHAHANLGEFLKEVFRVLKPSGRFLALDGYRGVLKNEHDEHLVRQFCEGLAVERLVSPYAFISELSSNGFVNVDYEDKTVNVLPTSKKMYRMSLWSHPLSVLLVKLGLVPNMMQKNNKAGVIQKTILEQGVLQYGIIYAEKSV